MSKAAFLIATSAFFLDGATAAFNTRGHRTFVQDILLGNPFVFFFFFFCVCVFLRHILNPRAWSPSIFSLMLHLSDLKPSPSPSISDQKPSPHPPSPISTVTLHLSDLNPRLTLHLRSPPSPSISPISSCHPYPPSMISTLTVTLHLSLWNQKKLRQTQIWFYKVRWLTSTLVFIFIAYDILILKIYWCIPQKYRILFWCILILSNFFDFLSAFVVNTAFFWKKNYIV